MNKADSDTQIVIRDACRADAPGLEPLLGDVGFPAEADLLASRIEEFQTLPADIMLVALTADQIRGVLTIHLTPALHREQPVGRITLLVIAPTHRGQGIGRALVEEAEDRLLKLDCNIVEVISNRRYDGAHKFYQRLGYNLTSFKFKKTLPFE